jgi:hypothetical protein
MVASEASDLYASNTYTWSATSSGPREKDELAVDSTPLWLPYSLGVLPRVYNEFALLEHLILINVLDV